MFKLRVSRLLVSGAVVCGAGGWVLADAVNVVSWDVRVSYDNSSTSQKFGTVAPYADEKSGTTLPTDEATSFDLNLLVQDIRAQGVARVRRTDSVWPLGADLSVPRRAFQLDANMTSNIPLLMNATAELVFDVTEPVQAKAVLTEGLLGQGVTFAGPAGFTWTFTSPFNVPTNSPTDYHTLGVGRYTLKAVSSQPFAGTVQPNTSYIYFEYVAVPEPASAAALVVGAGATPLLRRRR